MLKAILRALRGLDDWRLWGALVVTAVGIAAVESQQHWPPPGGEGRAIVKLSIYWGLWLLWPAMLLMLMRTIGHALNLRLFRMLVSAGLLVLFGGLAWARFIEPNQIRVVETSISTQCGMRVALVSDIHSGLFGRSGQIEALVSELNAQDVAAVLIAGDFTYEPERDLRRALGPLAALRHKTYAVLGNHDEASPGPVLREPLLKTLADLRIEVIEGRRVPFGRCELAGLGDYLSGEMAQDVKRLESVKPLAKPGQRIVLTHDPDTQLHLPENYAGVLLGAHTHGGQINLPWLTDAMLARTGEGGFKRGLYERPNMRVFVTSGTGMVKLPLRFRMPPTIDILTF